MSIIDRLILLVFLSLTLAACVTPPEPMETIAEEPVPAPVVEAPALAEEEPILAAEEPISLPAAPAEEAEKKFDPSTISEEVFQSTKVDIQHFVENLNRIIRAKDFETWYSYLSDDCRKTRNSPAYLEQWSKSPRLQNQKPLANVRDYFLRVVVPSRYEDRVDDIEFITESRIKAYTLNAKGVRLRLYDLENIGGMWKIID